LRRLELFQVVELERENIPSNNTFLLGDKNYNGIAIKKWIVDG